ncbi:patatin family protein [Lottiidibacillus patelloidae]|uniref:Patatin family protein n=1 Tax=Lottiidibacillus patelloidae TaxID=2670334 RepID=A0A263BU28_9BACI|nr:patatin family protein [Lottiidibacillus patelloidae]
MNKIGLVLEGGGMRGTYTAGVLEFLMDKNLYFPYVIGVSAGACNGSSYISRQKERNKIVNLEYVNQPQYLSARNFIKKQQLFDMDFIFEELPNIHVPFDYETFKYAKEQFIVGTTDISTGKPIYFSKEQYHDHIPLLLRASSSIPIVAPVVEFEDMKLLDGGIVDPIPIKKSELDGNSFNVVILTRNDDYVKKQTKMKWIAKRFYKEYPALIKVLEERHEIYNNTISYIKDQEEKGNIFVFRPSSRLKVSSIERNTAKLTELYYLGYKDAQTKYEHLLSWIKQRTIDTEEQKDSNHEKVAPIKVV